MRHSEDYIISEPFAEPIKLTYGQAIEELARPADAVPLDLFPKLTRLTGGFREKEFSILCGATGVGKTTLIACVSRSLVEQGIPHFVASVETGRTDFVKRVISSTVEEDWNTGDPIAVEKLKRFHATHGHRFISESLHLSRYENRFSVEQLMSDIAWHVVHKGCKLAFIDNLNFFLEVKKAADQVIEMDRVIHELIIFCKNVPVHVVMVMHPKKTDHGRVESEFDIKGSSTAVQEAHNVFLFNRPAEDLIAGNWASKFDRELKIAKMRRKGRASGARLILRSINGVAYTEGEVV